MPTNQDQEAFEILSQEMHETRQAYQQDSAEVDMEAAEHLEKLERLVIGHTPDLKDKVVNERDKIAADKQEFQRLTQQRNRTYDAVEDLEYRWNEFVHHVENAARPEGEDEEEILNNVNNSLIQATEELNAILSNFLRPLWSNEDDVHNEEREALEDLRDQLEDSVGVHQQLNRYKQILIVAQRDHELQQQIAESEHVPDLDEEVHESGNGIQRLERQVEEIEGIEREFLSELEDATEVIREKMEIDQEVIAEMTDQTGEARGKGSQLFSRFVGSEDSEIIPMLQSIQQDNPVDRLSINIEKGLIRPLQDELKPAARAILQDERGEERAEEQLLEELETYIGEHQSLFEEDVEGEAESMIPRGEIDPNDSNWPKGTMKFARTIEEMLEMRDREILKSLKSAHQNYRRTYRIDEDEIEKVDDFVSRAEELETMIMSVERDFDNHLYYDNAWKARGSEETPNVEFMHLINGEQDFDYGLQQIMENVGRLKADIMKIYEDENQYLNNFKNAHNQLAEEKQNIREFMEKFKEFKSQAREFRNPEHPASGEGRRVYHDAFVGAGVFLYGEDSSSEQEAAKKLSDEIVGLREWMGDVKKELDSIDRILREEVKEEKVEEDKLAEALQDCKESVQELVKAFEGDESEPIPEKVIKRVNAIEGNLKDIAEKIDKELEPRQEQDEQQAAEESAATEDVEEEVEVWEEELDEFVEDDDFFEEDDEEFFGG